MNYQIGNIVKGRDINKSPKVSYLLAACPECGTVRWTHIRMRNVTEAKKRRCPSCRNRKTMEAREGTFTAPNRLNLVGKRFGRLLVIKDAGTRHRQKNHSESMWLCKCDCGNSKIITGSNLKTGDSTSCGCYNKERIKETKTIPEKEHRINRIIGIYIRSAAKKGLLFDLGREQFDALITSNCYYCGATPANKISPHGREIIYQGIDRLDNSKGYTSDNTVPCCITCNKMKKVLTYAEFLKHIQKIAENHCGLIPVSKLKLVDGAGI